MVKDKGDEPQPQVRPRPSPAARLPYDDKAWRKAYMAAYMRKWRLRQKPNGEAK